MFKPTFSLLAKAHPRIRLTTKRATVGGGYYKGNRTGALGRHTKHGGYVIDWRRVRTYVCPDDLDDFNLTPFITRKMEPLKGSYGRLESEVIKLGGNARPHGPLSGKRYLERWKLENGREDASEGI